MQLAELALIAGSGTESVPISHLSETMRALLHPSPPGLSSLLLFHLGTRGKNKGRAEGALSPHRARWDGADPSFRCGKIIYRPEGRDGERLFTGNGVTGQRGRASD